MSLALTQMVTNYFLLAMMALAGTVVSDLIYKTAADSNDNCEEDSGKRIMRYLGTSILPTLLVYVIRDMAGPDTPNSVYFLIVFVLGLVGYDLTKLLTNIKKVLGFIRSILAFLQKDMSEFNEFVKELEDEEEAKESKGSEDKGSSESGDNEDKNDPA